MQANTAALDALLRGLPAAGARWPWAPSCDGSSVEVDVPRDAYAAASSPRGELPRTD